MEFISKALLIKSSNNDEIFATILEFASAHSIELIEITEKAFLNDPSAFKSAAEHLITVLSDHDVAHYLALSERHEFTLGVIPKEKQTQIYEWFGFPKKVDEAIELAFSSKPKKVDLLKCNDEVALGLVMLGETPFLDGYSKTYLNRDHSLFERFLFKLSLGWKSLKNLFKIKPFAVYLTTTKEEKFHTAITGLVVIENDVRGPAGRLLRSNLSVQDGLISTLVIAPKSVGEYLSFLTKGLFQGEQRLSNLPRALNFIRCPEITIESEKPLTYFIDGQQRQAHQIHMKLYSKALQMNVPQDYFERGENKEVHLTEHLPRNEDRLKMIENHLPIFTHALEEEFKDLFRVLREMAQPHKTFLTLMILSAIVASLGLFLSSPAVIIGAMVLAPLMAPIISLAMGLLRGDKGMLLQSLQTIGVGMCLAMGTAALIALMVPIERITGEIAGRLQPNLLDLGVAIASGIAGAYANVREDVAKSVSGVAIAVALVPPLCVSGIGLGWLSWEVFSGSMLLFLTNLVGISLSAALTFLFLGYAPLTRAKKGLLVSMVLLLIIAIPLKISLSDMVEHWRLEQIVKEQRFLIDDKSVRLMNLDVNLKADAIMIEADLVSNQPVVKEDMYQIKQQLERILEQPVLLKLTPRLEL